MSTESLIEVLKAHLMKEGLCICKVSSGFPLMPVDGLEESQVLRGVVEVIDDSNAITEWLDAETTNPVHPEVLAALARAA